MSGPLVNKFEVPSWAGKPPPGLHLDVTKDGKMVQKLMIDEKKCYFFGRNKQLCDFCIDHASCSRVHSALVWHKHLARPFIVDLGSTHGTYIGSIRLDSKKPQQVPIDSELHFGASTRKYIIRERPQQMGGGAVNADGEKIGDDIEGGLLGLPETETELDNLTEFNTAHNRRIASMVDIPDVPTNPLKRKRKNAHVYFNDEEEVINPEDVDPSVGRFQNLVQTTVVPSKKMRLDSGMVSALPIETISNRIRNFQQSHHHHSLYADIPSTDGSTGMTSMGNIASKLGLPVPNLAPDIEPSYEAFPTVNPTPAVVPINVENLSKEPKKKKYAKEAWPGKKPAPSLLV